MNILRSIFTFIFLSVSLFLYSQSSPLVQVNGMVVDQNRQPVSYAHIENMTRRKGVLAKSDGEFNFFAEKGDTLVFACVGYKKVTKIIPRNFSEKIYYLVVVMKPDTIVLPETQIIPWQNYTDFKEAILEVQVPEDDYDRAAKNLAIMELQQLLFPDEIPSAAGAAAHIFRYEYYDRLYWKGQTQPMQIFNVMAWQKFFQYLKEGKFKQTKKKIKSLDDLEQ